MNARWLRRGMGWWQPFLGAGIRVKSFADDFRDVVVELKLGGQGILETPEPTGASAHRLAGPPGP